MSDKLIKCTMADCFGNNNGFCNVLARRCKGICPFYKSIEEVQAQEKARYGYIIHYQIKRKKEAAKK